MYVKKQKTNNLIKVTKTRPDGTDDIHYFTTCCKTGTFLYIAGASVQWAIDHHKTLFDEDGSKTKIEMIDGSEIPYKLINNI